MSGPAARNFHKFPALRPGDTVAVVAPAGPFDRESFDAGFSILASRYRARYDEGIFQRHRYLAGTDTRRLAELNQAFADPAVRAVFTARGGYGAMRLLPQVQLSAKPLIGFSDVTALHLCQHLAGTVGIHGPVLTQLGRLLPSACERLFSLLESTAPAPALSAHSTLVPGTAEGRLVGGNLCVLSELIGTPWMPDLTGCVLLLEDVGEVPYRLDRMWTHLGLAGVFQQVRGIALGTFTRCEQRDAGYSSLDVLRDLATATGLPCAEGFPIGHGDLNEAVPLGIRVRLDATTRSLTFLESAAQ